MKNYKFFLTFILLFSTLEANAEFRLGKDYGSISRPLPVKQDGVVEVLEIFWYSENGLNSKPKANMNDHFDMMFDELDYLNIIHNTRKFKEIVKKHINN